MNADLRKMREVEKRSSLTPQQRYDQVRAEIHKLPLQDQSYAMAHLVTGLGFSGLAALADPRPYLIDSDGVPPREGEFEK